MADLVRAMPISDLITNEAINGLVSFLILLHLAWSISTIGNWLRELPEEKRRLRSIVKNWSKNGLTKAERNTARDELEELPKARGAWKKNQEVGVLLMLAVSTLVAFWLFDSIHDISGLWAIGFSEVNTALVLCTALATLRARKTFGPGAIVLILVFTTSWVCCLVTFYTHSMHACLMLSSGASTAAWCILGTAFAARFRDPVTLLTMAAYGVLQPFIYGQVLPTSTPGSSVTLAPGQWVPALAVHFGVPQGSGAASDWSLLAASFLKVAWGGWAGTLLLRRPFASFRTLHWFRLATVLSIGWLTVLLFWLWKGLLIASRDYGWTEGLITSLVLLVLGGLGGWIAAARQDSSASRSQPGTGKQGDSDHKARS